MCWVLRKKSDKCYEVGYYYFDGKEMKFYVEDTFDDMEDAEDAVHYLNGGN